MAGAVFLPTSIVLSKDILFIINSVLKRAPIYAAFFKTSSIIGGRASSLAPKSLLKSRSDCIFRQFNAYRQSLSQPSGSTRHLIVNARDVLPFPHCLESKSDLASCSHHFGKDFDFGLLATETR
jgi:hypothetical protein